jgi:hypothetical protein
MNLIVAIYAGLLFFLLSPNVLLRIPKKGSTKMVAFVHAIVFGITLFLSYKLIMWAMNQMSVSGKEGLDNPSPESPSAPLPSVKKQGGNPMEGLGQKCGSSNDCNGGEVCGPEGTCAAAQP